MNLHRVPICYWDLKNPGSGRVYTKDYARRLTTELNAGNTLFVNFAENNDIKYVVGICQKAELKGNIVYGFIEWMDNTPEEVINGVNDLKFSVVPKATVQEDGRVTADDVEYFSFIHVHMPGAGSKIKLPAQRKLIL